MVDSVRLCGDLVYIDDEAFLALNSHFGKTNGKPAFGNVVGGFDESCFDESSNGSHDSALRA